LPQQISLAAAGLSVNVETLLDFGLKGWVKTVEKNGTVYLAGDQRYRAKYILHLRDQKQLNDDQIELVLSIQRPPYSIAQVDEILREHAPAPIAGPAGEPKRKKPSGKTQPGIEERAQA
jgi:hypothetical protein